MSQLARPDPRPARFGSASAVRPGAGRGRGATAGWRPARGAWSTLATRPAATQLRELLTLLRDTLRLYEPARAAKHFPLVEDRALYVASLGLAVSDRGCAVRGGRYLRQRYVLQLFIDDRVHRGGAHLLGDLDAKGADVCHLKHDAGLLSASSIIHAP